MLRQALQYMQYFDQDDAKEKKLELNSKLFSTTAAPWVKDWDIVFTVSEQIIKMVCQALQHATHFSFLFLNAELMNNANLKAFLSSLNHRTAANSNWA